MTKWFKLDPERELMTPTFARWFSLMLSLAFVVMGVIWTSIAVLLADAPNEKFYTWTTAKYWFILAGGWTTIWLPIYLLIAAMRKLRASDQ